MTVTKNKSPLVVPPAVSRRAGIKHGDELEFRVSGGIITIVPKLPWADDEYTPEQRAVVDARLAESEAEFRAGRGHGPFDSSAAMIAHMKAQLRKVAATKKKTKRSR